MGAMGPKRAWRKMFFGLFVVEFLTGVFYQRVGRLVFGKNWYLQTLNESAIHLIWLVIVFSPVIYAYVLWYERTRSQQLSIIEDKDNKFESLFLKNSSSIVVLDPTGRPLRFNPTFETVSGYTLSEVQAMDERRLQEVLQFCEWTEPMQRAVNGEEMEEFEISLKTKSGRTRVMKNSVIPMTKMRRVGGYYVVMRDVTEARDAELRMWKMAHFDTITHLCNRDMFVGRLKDALDVAKKASVRLAILFIDLDGFKNINDALGHRIGDEVLKSVAGRLVECVSQGETVARFGGDEFAILIPAVHHVDEASDVAKRVLSAIANNHVVESYQLSVGASIGIAVYPVSGDSPEALLQSADQAMYEAKRNGRNRYVVHLPVMQQITYSRLTLENDLRSAVQRDHELFVEYQPQVDVKTGRVVSAEALVRWNHPTLGPLLPGEFIPLAEEIGIIRDIGRGVLTQVCKQIREWQQASKRPVPISVNVSAAELSEESFTAEFLNVLEEFQVKPSLIAIEITETTLMKNEDKVGAALGELRRAGVTICVDDFGRGYNSLGLLKRLSVDVLKIDRMFVSKIHEDLADRSIVSALISMSHAQNWRVIAEGVERVEDLDVLREEDCDTYQGFLFSPSISPQWLDEKLFSHSDQAG